MVLFSPLERKVVVETRVQTSVSTSFEMLTMLLGTGALRSTRSPRSLDCLTSSWPREDARTWGSTRNNFAPQLGKDCHSEPLPGYPWDTDWGRNGCKTGRTRQNEPLSSCLADQVVMTVLDHELPQTRAVALASP